MFRILLKIPKSVKNLTFSATKKSAKLMRTAGVHGMKPSSKKPLSYMQAGNRDLQFIFSKIRQLEEVNKQVADYLGPALATNCQVGNMENGKLILIVANASVATQLRFQSADLIQQFKSNALLKNIREIQCKVRTVSPVLNPSTNKKQQQVCLLSQDTADIVQSMADSLEDPKLRQIMQRIATRKR